VGCISFASSVRNGLTSATIVRCVSSSGTVAANIHVNKQQVKVAYVVVVLPLSEVVVVSYDLK
jgi:hypothetical protein